MLDIGWMELMVVGVVALLVVGPKELPALLRTIGRFVGMAKRQADQFRAQFDEAIRETEFEDLRREMDDLRSGRFTEPKSTTTSSTSDKTGDGDATAASSGASDAAAEFEDGGRIEPAPEFRDEEEVTSFTMADGTVVRKGEPPQPPPTAAPATSDQAADATATSTDTKGADADTRPNAETVR